MHKNLTEDILISMNIIMFSYGAVPEHRAVCWVNNRGVVTLGGGGLCGEGSFWGLMDGR